MEREIIASTLLGALVVLDDIEKQRKKRVMYVNPYLIERGIKGRFVKDFEDMKKNSLVFYENFHMDVKTFEEVFALIEPYLLPVRDTRPWDRISPKEKFAIVIEYFASGSLQRHMASIYRISKQHLGKIIDAVCLAIIDAMKAYVPAMTNEQFVMWANDFNSQWQFPNCIGAIDGKHVALKAPPNSGSLFYNYKGYHSIVLMAVADSNYKFTYLDIGAYGSEGDANVFSSSKFGDNVLNERLDFPHDTTINGKKVPYVFLADDAFPLCKRIIKPYGGKGNLSKEETIFNYRLSRARRCVENAFGILCWKWLCLKRTMFCSPDRAQKIVTACCLLHNYLLENKANSYCPRNLADHLGENDGVVEGEWRTSLSEDSLYKNPVAAVRGRPTEQGKAIRNHLMRYVNSSVGSVPWQWTATHLDKD